MKQSTKFQSYQKTPKISKRELIYQTILELGPVSRATLADETKMLLSSVCGRANELIKEGRIKVTSVGYDFDTDRKVELLDVVQLNKAGNA